MTEQQYASHVPVLIGLLRATSGTVVELGMGRYSTPLIHAAAKASGRTVFSFETDEPWYHRVLNDYQEVDESRCVLLPRYEDAIGMLASAVEVVMIDSAPTESRLPLVKQYRARATYLIIHDTEPESEMWYKLSGVLSTFKYRRDYEVFRPQTSIVSDYCEIPEFDWTLEVRKS